MKFYKKTQLICLVVLLSSTAIFAQNSGNVKLMTDSLAKPALFAQGVISTPYTEWSLSFTPDGKTVYTSRGAVYWTIIYSNLEKNKWQKPQVASFSGKWRDTDPFITPDGKKLFFVSNRPSSDSSQDKPQPDFHIWYVDKTTANEWGKPHCLDTFINMAGVSNYAPSVDKNGNLYFCSRDRGTHSGMQGYVAKLVKGNYEKPVLISIAGVDGVQDPFIAPNDNYLLFINGNDLYISYSSNNGWSPANKLNAEINNGDGNSSPCISPDGKMLYYSSARMHGFYKREPKNHSLNYDELVKENNNCFNGQPNILMIPVHFSKG